MSGATIPIHLLWHGVKPALVAGFAALTLAACDLSADSLDTGGSSEGKPAIPPGAQVKTDAGTPAPEGQEGMEPPATGDGGAEGTEGQAPPDEGAEGSGPEGGEGSEGGEGEEGDEGDEGTEGSEGSEGTEGGEGQIIDLPPPPDADFDKCDRLDESRCALPFPSSYYLAPDATTPTGYHVAFGKDSLPVNSAGKHLRPQVLAGFDGFSPISPMITYFPKLDISNLPKHSDPEASLSPDSPIIVLNLTTGERVPFFAELDELTSQNLPEEQALKALVIRPLDFLGYNSRIAVAIRDLKDTQGEAYKPSPAFLALRDGTVTSDEELEARRAGFEEIFTALEGEGVDRLGLQLAWDFHTKSRENANGRLLFMRDDAMKRAQSGIPYTITNVKDYTPEENQYRYRRIEGTFKVALYLTKAEPGALLNTEDDGFTPKFNGFADVPFLFDIARKSVDSGVPAGLFQYGHGLLGDRGEQFLGERKIMDRYNYNFLAVDWWGLAEDDVPGVTTMVADDLTEFRIIPERLHQGVLNALMAMHFARTELVKDPNFIVNGKPVIDPERTGYYGNSQGGIMGAVYMGLSTEVTRGVLGEAGAPYSLLLPRSVDFTPFWQLLRLNYRNTLDLALCFGLMQLSWDSAEPSAYVRHISLEPLPGTPEHRVIMHVARGDHQVHHIGSRVLAKAAGIKVLKPAVRPVWGLEEVEAPYEGSAWVEFDFGNNDGPDTNLPPEDGEDPHDKVRELDAAIDQIGKFFETGIVEHYCDGPCDPE